MDYQTSGYGKRPMWQWILLYVVIGAIAYGLIYYFAFSGKGGYGTSYQPTAPYTQQQPPQSATPPLVQNQPSVTPPIQNPVTTPAPVSGQNVVTYTDAGFSPSTLTVKKGDMVVFKNTASDAMWVSSNPHPLHNRYPTTGGCVASTFDACKDITPGTSWSFTFGIAGTWGYHNHLNPGEGGTIVVQ